MSRFFATVCGTLTLAALSGCCMVLDEQQPPRINEIVEKHQQNVNRPEELKLLCGKGWMPVYIKGQEAMKMNNSDDEDAKDNKKSASKEDMSKLHETVNACMVFKQDGKISGFSGVNVFNGSFAVIAPNLLRFGVLSAPQDPGSHLDYEMLLMAQLKDVDHFELLKNGQIEFKKRDVLMIRCKPVPFEKIKSNPLFKDLVSESKKAVKGKSAKPARRVNRALQTVEGVSEGK